MTTTTTTVSNETVWSQIRYRLFETSFAALCALLPALLLWSAGTADRDSISAYYDMSEAQIFYYGLTVAAMLLIVNGVLREKNVFYTVLGAALSGVILFNHDDWKVIHSIAAWAFFLGSIVVIIGIARGSLARTARPILAVLAIAALVGYFLFGVPNFFYAEWAALVAIAAHFILHAWLPDSAYKGNSNWNPRLQS